MSWIVFGLLAVVFLWVIARVGFFQTHALTKKWLLAAFVLKVLAGAAMVVLYTFYYTDKQNSDIYKYFDDGMFLHSLAASNPKLFFKLMLEWKIETPEVLAAIKQFNHWDPKVRSSLYNDSRIVIKLNALLAFVSRGNVYTHSLVASFLGFAGLVSLLKAVENLGFRSKFYPLLLLFFPSVMMWTSAMLKETVLMMVVGFFLLIISKIKEDYRKPMYWFVMLLLLLLLAIFKVYVLLCFVAAAIFYVLSNRLSSKWAIGFLGLIFFMAVITAVFAADKFLLQQAFLQSLAQKQLDSIKLAHYMNAGSIVFIPVVDADAPISFLLSMPRALWNVLCGPMIWKVDNLLLLALAVENILLAVLLSAFIFSAFKLSIPQCRVSVAIFIFCGLLFLIIGITTPVLGSIVRYRVPGVAVLLLPCCMALDELVKRRKLH